MNDVGLGDRSYLGGASEFTALITVVREIPSRSAIRAFGTPSPASLLISAQSSKVITLQSLSAHFSPPKVFSFRPPPTAVEHAIIISIWHILSHHQPYRELGTAYYQRRDPQLTIRRIVKQANDIGLTVRFDPIEATT